MAMADGNQRMRQGLEAVAGVWLVALPLLRPLVWNGDPGDLPNLFFLILLAAATATGLMLRGMSVDTVVRPRAWGLWLGMAFLAWAAVGCLRSPLPAQAWLLWSGWALHLAAPIALWPELRRRPLLVVAGLCAGLGLEMAVMVGQMLWERPAMQRDLALDPDLVPHESMRGQYTVRVHSWRLEGTFLLANTLAAFLILLWPLVIERAVRLWRMARRPWSLVLGAAVTAALALTGSKAAILAWLVVLTLVVATWRPRWRLLAMIGCLVVLGVALAVPAVRAKAVGSFAERWGYWRGAVTLVAERPLAGWGLDGFAVHFPRVKPPGTEPTVVVHNEPLQAACDLGLIGAVLLMAWWAWVLIAAFGNRCPMSGTMVAGPDHDEVQHHVPLTAGLAVAVVIFTMGVLHPNLRSYPGGVWWWWGLVYAVAAGLLVHGALRLPRPAPTACAIGVAMCLLHSLADFTLHSMQVVGALAWVGALAVAGREPPAQAVRATSRRENGGALAGLAVVLAALLLMAWGQDRVVQRDRGRAIVEALRRTMLGQERGDRTRREDALERLNVVLMRDGLPPVPADAPAPHQAPQVAELAVTVMRDLARRSVRWPADVDLAHGAADLAAQMYQMRPDLAPTLGETMRLLVAHWPDQPFAVQGMAWHLRRLARMEPMRFRTHLLEAQDWLRRAVALTPGFLPIREQLIEVSRELGDQDTVEREGAELRRLAPIVHETGRLEAR